MRLRATAALIAALSMTHFTLVTGEMECVTTSSSDGQTTRGASADDCGHMPMESSGAPRTARPPHNAPAHHGWTHGALCCAALAGCATVLSSAASTSLVGETVPSARVAQSDSDDVPAPHFPPETPPPKA